LPSLFSPPWRVLLAAIVPLASAMHLATGPHPDSFPGNWRVMAFVAFLYAPAVALLVASLLSDGAVRWILRRRVAIPVWLSIPFSGIMSVAFIDRGADFVLGAILSGIGMALVVILPQDDAPRLRRMIVWGLGTLTIAWLAANLAFAGVVHAKAQALGDGACLYIHDPDGDYSVFDVLPVRASTWPLLLQRLIADRPADPYLVAYRLELRQGDALYHWSMRQFDFVPTEPDFIVNLETRPCPTLETVKSR
jgi:hypothetical protein